MSLKRRKVMPEPLPLLTLRQKAPTQQSPSKHMAPKEIATNFTDPAMLRF